MCLQGSGHGELQGSSGGCYCRGGEEAPGGSVRGQLCSCAASGGHQAVHGKQLLLHALAVESSQMQAQGTSVFCFLKLTAPSGLASSSSVRMLLAAGGWQLPQAACSLICLPGVSGCGAISCCAPLPLPCSLFPSVSAGQCSLLVGV